MRHREIELFNLSFLDILAGALGAVLFLFIVVPKGGKMPEMNPPLAITLDTVQGKFFGELPDSLWTATAGDSILSIVVDFSRMPQFMDCPPIKKCPKCPEVLALKEIRKPSKPIEQLTKTDPVVNSSSNQSANEVKKESQPVTQPITSKYKGDLPSVPCKFSVEIMWEDITNNVDLYLCKDGQCVYGARRKNPSIGFWDSGKSKTSLFGGDLRTTQESIRQFDTVIPGNYNIYAQFKASEKGLSAIKIDGLVYTKTSEKGEQGETFFVELPISKGERTLVGKIELKEDGSFQFIKQN